MANAGSSDSFVERYFAATGRSSSAADARDASEPPAKAPRAPAKPRARATKAKASSKQLDLNEAIRTRLSKELKAQGFHLDTFDPDFILGVIKGFLADSDAVLTQTGVRRYKR